MKKNVYNFENTETIYAACRMAQENKWVVLIEGASGLGKSFAFDYYKKKNPHVIVDGFEPGDRPISPWRRILMTLNQNDPKRYIGSFAFMTKQIAKKLKAEADATLIILDEGNFQSFHMLRHFRSLVDHTKGSAGFVISGPDYFLNEVKQWIKDGVKGVKQLDTRIDLYVKLSPPTHLEKTVVCDKEGISDPIKVRQICSRVDNFRDLFREIEFFHKGIDGKKEWEWGTGISESSALPQIISNKQ